MAEKKQFVTILGSTGSIGKSTLDVINDHQDKFVLYALTANKNYKLLLQQVQQFHPRHVVIVDEQAAASFQHEAAQLQLNCIVHIGAKALEMVASESDVDVVMAAIVGAAGLLPTLAAAKSGKRILLANKEALVMSGELLMKTVQAFGASLLPVDSEHNAIYQCLPNNFNGQSLAELGIRKIILTASGGPFLKTPFSELKTVTPEQACNHPNWSMGRKISVDSATMMNKGLELIEAHWLFSAPIEKIELLVQPQSVIHSMVEYIDGSVLAELGVPDMRTPIAHVLGLPARLENGVKSLDFVTLKQLDFLPLELDRYPLLKLVYKSLTMGKTAATCLNAANEVAVAAFLDNQIGFLQIADIVEQTLSTCELLPADNIENILAVDARAREISHAALEAM